MEYCCNSEATFNDRWLVEQAFFGKTDGFYIELGASWGYWGSATYCLEQLGWRGISVEANPLAYSKFIECRKNPCLNCAISGEEGEVEFVIPNEIDYQGLAAIRRNFHCSEAPEEYGGHEIISVESITFPTLLERGQCPKEIDLITMDIERSEVECLETFPFDRYRVQCFVVELSDEENITRILQKHGYRRVYNIFNTDALWEGYYWLGAASERWKHAPCFL